MLFFAYLRLVLACCVGTAALFYVTEALALEQTPSSDWRKELQAIDKELKEAQDLRDKSLAAARREEDKGMRWQFMQNEKQEAKRAFERADMKKEAARMLQQRIDQLNARKAQLLKEHPGESYTQATSKGDLWQIRFIKERHDLGSLALYTTPSQSI